MLKKEYRYVRILKTILKITKKFNDLHIFVCTLYKLQKIVNATVLEKESHMKEMFIVGEKIFVSFKNIVKYDSCRNDESKIL